MNADRLGPLLVQLDLYIRKADSLSYYLGKYRKIWKAVLFADETEQTRKLCDEMTCKLQEIFHCLKTAERANYIMEEDFCRLEKETGEDMQ